MYLGPDVFPVTVEAFLVAEDGEGELDAPESGGVTGVNDLRRTFFPSPSSADGGVIGKVPLFLLQVDSS